MWSRGRPRLAKPDRSSTGPATRPHSADRPPPPLSGSTARRPLSGSCFRPRSAGQPPADVGADTSQTRFLVLLTRWAGRTTAPVPCGRQVRCVDGPFTRSAGRPHANWLKATCNSPTGDFCLPVPRCELIWKRSGGQRSSSSGGEPGGQLRQSAGLFGGRVRRGAVVSCAVGGFPSNAETVCTVWV